MQTVMYPENQNCCNGPGCLSPEPEFMYKEPFIDVSVTKYTEFDREWIACRYFELKSWRKEIFVCWCRKEGIKERLLDSIIMLDGCPQLLLFPEDH